MFEPVRPKRLSDSAIEQILRLVREGRLEAGAKLPAERQLMDLLSVSRTSLREAIRTLETMGVLRVVPGRGTYVREDAGMASSEDWYAWLMRHGHEVVQILEMHEALEVKVAELAAVRATPAQLAELEALLEDMKRAVAEGDHAALVLADATFHRVIRDASKNEVIARLLRELEGTVDNTRQALMSMPSRVQRVVSDHQSILDSIRLGDPGIAAASVLVHVRRSKEELLSSGALGQLEGDGETRDARDEDAS